jgi:hypothetical protein
MEDRHWGGQGWNYAVEPQEEDSKSFCSSVSVQGESSKDLFWDVTGFESGVALILTEGTFPITQYHYCLLANFKITLGAHSYYKTSANYC